MTAHPRTIHLLYNLSGVGHHVAAWRHPDSRTERALDLDYYVELAREAERGLFDAVFIADTPVLRAAQGEQLANTPFEPVTLLSAIAARTRSIGIIPTLSYSYSEPYTVARQIASLDLLSRGRAGVNLVTSAGDAVARNYGFASQPAHDARYARAREYASALLQLWQSWEPAAVVFDRSGGILVDPKKIHPVNFAGEHISVAGPLNVPRSPQSRPVLLQAGASDDGIQQAGQFADAVYLRSVSLAETREFYRKIKEAAVAAGRAPDDVKVLPGIVPYVGRTRDEAIRLHDEIESLHVQSPYDLARLGAMLGIDLSDAKPDDPVPLDRLPDPSKFNGSVTGFVQLRNYAIEDKLTLGQLAHKLRSDAPLGMSAPVGSGEDLADFIEEWVGEGAADGFVLQIPIAPTGLTMFVDEVVPVLQKRGLFRTEYEGTTLQDRLGVR
ncbi:NtaA/DmoA family FMN-dependent monooxygenase [Rhizobium puerariae]|uniref:NtaA/DmoA family FMN-dependent monooxygenase n=1 Tax=Rhizobium puerariae TaxID=1585791 RepID=A0ABV6ADP1_9HYPH